MQIIQDYRALHQIPELDTALPKTVDYVVRALQALDCEITLPTKGAVCAFFYRNRQDTLAFRADMDALPVEEKTGLLFSSVHPGKMHACGHDGHTAILLETARRIHKLPALPHNVLLIFQPAEETAGGAKALCDTGLLEQYGVCAIFALHLWPGLPKGKFFSRPGVLMPNACEVTAEFTGNACHIAAASRSCDALKACCRFYQSAQRLPCFLKFGTVEGGTAANIVCEKAILRGTLRTRRKIASCQKKVKRLCQRTCRNTAGCVQFSAGYPALRNDPMLYRKIRKLHRVSFLRRKLWTTEDFSAYLNKAPGVYFLLGTGNTPPLHSPQFQFDETILPKAADFLQKIYTA